MELDLTKSPLFGTLSFDLLLFSKLLNSIEISLIVVFVEERLLFSYSSVLAESVEFKESLAEDGFIITLSLVISGRSEEMLSALDIELENNDRTNPLGKPMAKMVELVCCPSTEKMRRE